MVTSASFIVAYCRRCVCLSVWIGEGEKNCKLLLIKTLYKWSTLTIWYFLFQYVQSKVHKETSLLWKNQTGQAELWPQPHPRSLVFIGTPTACMALSPSINSSTSLKLLWPKGRKSQQPGSKYKKKKNTSPEKWRLFQQHINAHGFEVQCSTITNCCHIWVPAYLRWYKVPSKS